MGDVVTPLPARRGAPSDTACGNDTYAGIGDIYYSTCFNFTNRAHTAGFFTATFRSAAGLITGFRVDGETGHDGDGYIVDGAAGPTADGSYGFYKTSTDADDDADDPTINKLIVVNRAGWSHVRTRAASARGRLSFSARTEMTTCRLPTALRPPTCTGGV